MVIVSEVGKERQDVRGGLTGSGLRTGDDVMPVEDDRNGLLLHRSAGIEVHVPEGV